MLKNLIIIILLAIIATVSLKAGAEYIYVPDKKFTTYLESFYFKPEYNRVDINKFEDDKAVCYITVNQASGRFEAGTSTAISCLKK
jgi:hypothetical protein